MVTSSMADYHKGQIEAIVLANEMKLAYESARRKSDEDENYGRR